MIEQNKVEILDVMGSDESIIRAARVSFLKETKGIADKEIGLINYLVKHNHWSPFSHAQIQFRITCPIFVERQIFKTIVGVSVNSASGRYVDFSDSYWMPEQLRYQSKNSKQGSAEDLPPEINQKLIDRMREVVDLAQEVYAELKEENVAKELARVILPLNLNTTFVWTGSFYAFVRLCKLRLKDDAQKETRDLVAEMLNQVKSLENNPFEHALRAFNL